MNFVRATGVQSISLFRWTTLAHEPPPESLLQAQVEAFRILHIDVPLSEDFSLSQRQRLWKDAQRPQMQWPRSSLSPMLARRASS